MKSPHNYYQTLNLICYCEETKTYIPVFHIPMSSKNMDLYDSVFREIKFICIKTL